MKKERKRTRKMVTTKTEIEKINEAAGGKGTVIKIHPKCSEAYKMLHITMGHLINKMNIKTVVFSSLSDIENHTRHILSIANLMANAGKRILLLECTFKDSEVNQFLESLNMTGINNRREGISNFYISLCDGIIHIINMSNYRSSNFYISFCGQKVVGCEYMLNISNMTMILDDVKEKYDIILIDAPPVGYSADGLKLCSVADGTILTMRAGKTSVELATKTKEILDNLDAKIIGTILEK